MNTIPSRKIDDLHILSEYPVTLIEEKNIHNVDPKTKVLSFLVLLLISLLFCSKEYIVIIFAAFAAFEVFPVFKLLIKFLELVYWLNPPIIVSYKDEKLMTDIYRIRYKTFCQKLKWVRGDQERRLEYDEWDNKDGENSERGTVHIGYRVPFWGHIIAYVRITFGHSIDDYMLGNEFRSMLPQGSRFFVEEPRNNLEVTRLCIDSRIPKWFRGILIFYLFKRVCLWGREHNRLLIWSLTSFPVLKRIKMVGESLNLKYFIVSTGHMPGDKQPYVVSIVAQPK
jgi:N-acyl-L-homoserine lactone synthetase